MSEQRYRARLSLGYFDTPDERDRALFEAQSKLGSVASQEAPQRTEVPDRLSIPANVNLVPVRPLTLDLDSWLYASDFHCPLHDREYTKRLIAVAHTQNIDTLVIGGDLLDFASVSSHPKTQMQAGLNETLRVAGDLLYALSSCFRRIYILPGNHCRRVAKKLDEPLAFDMLIHAALRGRVASDCITTTDYDYLFVGPQETGWVVGHPRFFEGSGVPGLAKAALRERRNIIGSHTHAMSLSWTHDGRFRVIYPGHMTNANLTPYVMESRGLSKFAEWKSGFVLVNDATVQLFADGLVNWENYGVA